MSEFAQGSLTPTATLTGLNEPDALAFSGGKLYVANSGCNTMSELRRLLTPTATLTGVDVPNALAFDNSGDLYVANEYGGTVSRYRTG